MYYTNNDYGRQLRFSHSIHLSANWSMYLLIQTVATTINATVWSLHKSWSFDIFTCRNLEAAWIGYNDRLNEGSFHWFDSRISSGYTNWKPSEPNGRETENCGEVIPGKLYKQEWKGMWNDGSCTAKKSSVCQKPAGKTNSLQD